METNYPQPVNGWLADFHQSLTDSKFYQEHDINPTIGKQAVINQIGPAALQCWIDGDEFAVSTKEIETLLHKIKKDCILIGLIDKGIVESYFDSDGSEFYRLTSFGFAVQKELSNTNNK